MNHLRKLGLAAFFFLGLGLCSGAIAAPQTGVIVALGCYAIGLVLAPVAG